MALSGMNDVTGRGTIGMFSENAFLRTILAHPEDDAPRLVYADWLEENGAIERAEFIRLQCAAVDKPRQQMLLATHGAVWVEPVFRHVYSASFQRGFVDEVTIDARTLLSVGAEMFQAAPIRLLRIIGARRTTMSGAGRALDFSGRPLLDDILRMPELARLRSLHLTACMIGDEGAAQVARCTQLANLHVLRLGDNSLSDQAVEALTDSINLGSLQTLVLSKNKIGDLGATLLADPRSKLAKLQTLDLSDNLIGEVGADALAQARRAALPALRKLDISNQFKGWTAEFSLREPLNPIQPPQRRALISRYGSSVCVF